MNSVIERKPLYVLIDSDGEIKFSIYGVLKSYPGAHKAWRWEITNQKEDFPESDWLNSCWIKNIKTGEILPQCYTSDFEQNIKKFLN